MKVILILSLLLSLNLAETTDKSSPETAEEHKELIEEAMGVMCE